ncbi:hypothetical protein BU15DRAFT_58593 [Melanogaster broomeanus]|nr:hypothetical protein BU15DRAFT_58593 [Melanogaster broomeanus]
MVAASATKKTATKSALGAPPTEKATHHATHPSWIDMITECITTTRDGTRQGVSRPTIKKYVDSKYHLPINAASTSQLNRAIAHGADKGNFVLPKGPSGKVKLAPKRLGGAAKENTRPPSKRPAAAAKVEPAPAPKAKTTVKKLPCAVTKTKAKPVSGEQTTPPKAATAARKYTSAAKKAHVTTAPGRKVPARKATTKRGGAKKLCQTAGSDWCRREEATHGGKETVKAYDEERD